MGKIPKTLSIVWGLFIHKNRGMKIVNIDENYLSKDEIVIKGFRIINIIKSPFQKLSFKNQKKLKSILKKKIQGCKTFDK